VGQVLTIAKTGLIPLRRQLQKMKTRTKTLLYLLVLSLVDSVIPIPILGIVLFYVLFQKPDWFRALVADIYGA
jgi:hypothetical protein